MRHHYTVRTYEELRQWAQKFADAGQLHSFVIFGAPGLGKSETFSRALDAHDVVRVKGRLSAFQLFNLIGANIDALFLFDDTRRILKDEECLNLLMSLGEHQITKTVQWNTSTLPKAQPAHGVDPNQVVTRSRIVLIINKLDEDNEDLEPLISRSVVICFAPSKEEVHRYVGEWFVKDAKSREIYDYIGNHLRLIPMADVRDYTSSLAVHDMNWKDRLHEAWTGDEYLTAALKVVNDAAILPGGPQVERFAELCGGSLAQFFRLKKLLMPLHDEPVSQSHPFLISAASPAAPVTLLRHAIR